MLLAENAAVSIPGPFPPFTPSTPMTGEELGPLIIGGIIFVIVAIFVVRWFHVRSDEYAKAKKNSAKLRLSIKAEYRILFAEQKRNSERGRAINEQLLELEREYAKHDTNGPFRSRGLRVEVAQEEEELDRTEKTIEKIMARFRQ